MTTKTKKILTHVCLIALMFIVTCVFFSPILQGKSLQQGDVISYQGMSKANKDYHEETGDYAIWSPSMFSGMPAYQITEPPKKTIFTPLGTALSLSFNGDWEDLGVLFLYLLGFYAALAALGVSPWLALLGALAFGLGSYNIIIIEAGHITKAHAMAMIAPILAGMILCFRRKYVWGGILFTLALGLQFHFNHIQITYYTMIGGLILGLTYLIYSIKDKKMKSFGIGAAILVVGCAFAIGTNARHLFENQEYSKYTMRGGSELTIRPEHASDMPTNDKGLDINYAYSWSYGVGETYTLLVPGAYGGGSGEKVSKDSECYKTFRQDRLPLYWGNQPFTSGPVYFGAIIIFLFVLGMFVVKGPERWWILIASILSIMMAWGRNFMGLNEWLFNHLPLYNMFRTPSMSLVLANVCMVLMAILALKAVFEAEDKKKITRSLYWATGITGGFIILMMLCKGAFSFTGASDAQMANAYGDQWSFIQNLFIAERESLFMHDSWRSLFLIIAAAAVLWMYSNEKLKKSGWVIGILTVLIVCDLWNVDRRYIDDNNYVSGRQAKLAPAQYDYDIDQIATMYGDEDYRVLNLAVNTFNDATPSAFHNQIGGYHAAKLRRYQDLIDFYISYHIDLDIINMLNGRYIVLQNGQVQRNPDALGNAWFVDNYQLVENPDAEIKAIGEINPAQTATIDQCWKEQLKGLTNTQLLDSTATIEMVHNKPYNPDHLTYKTHATKKQLAVFSEIYYAPDWRAYIDGKPAEYFRANYVLRSMIVPAGNHTIEFINEAPLMHKLDNINLIVSIVLVVVIAGVLIVYYHKRKETKE